MNTTNNNNKNTNIIITNHIDNTNNIDIYFSLFYKREEIKNTMDPISNFLEKESNKYV